MGAHLGESGRCTPHETNRVKVGVHRCQSFPPAQTAVFASAHALSELDLLREPLSAAAHAAGERVRKLESSGAFSCSKIKLPMLNLKLRSWPTLVEASPRLQMCGNCLVRASKTIGRTGQTDGQLIRPTHHAGLATIPSSFLRVGSARRLGSPCQRGRDQEYLRNELLYLADDIEERHPGPKRALPSRKRGVQCRTYFPLLRNTMTWPLQSLKNTCESKRFTGPKNLSATVLMTFKTRICVR